MTDQGRLFNPDLFSPVTSAVVWHLPASSARSFWIASLLGRWLPEDGSNRPPKNAKEVAGTLITRRKRAVILKVLDIDVQRWYRLVKDWEGRYLAHKCGPSTVFLFAKWLYADCPACKAPIYIEGAPPKP